MIGAFRARVSWCKFSVVGLGGMMGAVREAWVDLAKGIAILLVVLAHSVTVLEQQQLALPGWSHLNDILTTLRMPTFFLISGLFSRPSLLAPFRGFMLSKLAKFTYLYVLWSLVVTAAFAISAVVNGTEPSVSGELLTMVTLNGTLWYLPALAAFFGLARMMRNVPPIAQVAGSAGLSVLFGSNLLNSGSWGLDHMAQYFVCFLVGLYYSSFVREAAGRVRWLHVAVWAVLWVGTAGLFFYLGGIWLNIGGAILPVFAVPFAICLAARVSHWRVGMPFVVVGKNTLPVYVIHYPIVLAAGSFLPGVLPHNLAMLLLLPVFISAFAAAVAFALGKAIQRIPGLLDLPTPWTAVVEKGGIDAAHSQSARV